MKMTNNEKEFVEWIKSECRASGVTYKLKPVKYLKLSDGIRCSGYFDEEDRVLAVSMNRPDWIEILAHEYCHLTQWREGSSLWKRGCSGIEKVDHWLGGGEVKGIKRWMGYSRDLELDNEKRTVKLLKKWNLGVDLKLYVKKSNAYLQFYNYLLITRRWSKPTNQPYTNQRILDAVPDSFRMDYSRLSERLHKLYHAEGI